MRWTSIGIGWLFAVVAATGCGPGGGGAETDAGGDATGDIQQPDPRPDTSADTGVGDTGEIEEDTVEDTGTDTGTDTGKDVAQEPTLAFANLSDGDAVNGSVTVAAAISGTDAIQSVEFLIGGESIETTETAPYEFEWATNLYDEKAHELQLIATLEGGATTSADIEVWVDRTGPTVEVVEPKKETVYVDTVPMKATVGDNYDVEKVVFQVDANTAKKTLTSPPWETMVDLTTADDGLHSVGVTAQDAAGLKTQKSVTFTLGCTSDDHCTGEKVCVQDTCQTLTPQCSQVGDSCNPDSRRPAGANFACKDTGFGAECRPTCTVTSDPSASSCGSGSICLGAQVGNQGYCVDNQCSGLTDTSSCSGVQANDLFSDYSNGAKCRAIGNDTNLCVPAGGQGIGETCNAVSPVVGFFCDNKQHCEACGTGASCLNGTCHTICQGDAACSSDPEGSVCVGESDADIFDSGVGFCDEKCEAFSRGQCSQSDEGCVPLNNSVGYCHEHGSKGYMATCDPPDDANPNRRECGEGMQCLRLQSKNSVTGQKEVARCLPRCKPPAQGGTGTEDNDVTCRGTVHGRFVHLLSSPSTLDIYVDGTRKVDDLNTDAVSDADPTTSARDFQEFTAAELQLEAVDGTQSNNSNPLAASTPTITSGEAVSLAVTPGKNGPTMFEFPVPRGISTPPSGKTAVRVVQAVPDFGTPVDVEMVPAGDATLSNATTLGTDLRRGAGEFLEVDSGNYDVYVFDATQSTSIGNELKKFAGITLPAQGTQSLYVKGTDSGSDSEAVEVTAIPYRSAPDAIARTCWASGDDPAPASGICLQGCQIGDYGDDSCAGASNGCSPFGQRHYCLPRGSATPGDACTPKVQSAYSDCEEGAYCEERGDGSGECASYCLGGSSSNTTLSCQSGRTCSADSGNFGTCKLSCTPGSDFKDTTTCPSNLQSCLPASGSSGNYTGAFCSASGMTSTGNNCGEGRPAGSTILQNCEAGNYCAYGDGTEQSLLAGMFQQRAGSKPTCRNSCNPFGSSSCPSGQACGIDLVYGGGTAAGLCLDEASSASSATTGTSCNASDVGNMCGDHSICIPNQGQHICLEFCRWSDKRGCSGRMSCQKPDDGLIAGVLGFCLP